MNRIEFLGLTCLVSIHLTWGTTFHASSMVNEGEATEGNSRQESVGKGRIGKYKGTIEESFLPIVKYRTDKGNGLT